MSRPMFTTKRSRRLGATEMPEKNRRPVSQPPIPYFPLVILEKPMSRMYSSICCVITSVAD